MQVFYRYLLYRAAAKANLSRFPHRQAGYASVLFLAIFAAIGLAVFSLYDSGVVATERVRLQNTADNVAYSTATMITRDMNVIAITNRAMVANQKKRGQPDLFVFSCTLNQALNHPNLANAVTCDDLGQKTINRCEFNALSSCNKSLCSQNFFVR